MSQPAKELLAVYVYGESKTGKGVAGKAINQALVAAGYAVYYDVAGDFFRRFVALIRQQLALGEDDQLPTGQTLESAAAAVYATRQAFDAQIDLGDLQRPAISNSVSVLGEQHIAQKAANEWFAEAVKQAQKHHADILLLDGRNPRRRVQETTDDGHRPKTVLDLCMICDPVEAARRVLGGDPSPEALSKQADEIRLRRELDRQRSNQPFQVPKLSVSFIPGVSDPRKVIEQSWQSQGDVLLPLSITDDNSYIDVPIGRAAIVELALAAIIFAKEHDD